MTPRIGHGVDLHTSFDGWIVESEVLGINELIAKIVVDGAEQSRNALRHMVLGSAQPVVWAFAEP
ncbi:hypothetical protein C2L65_05440 [Paraburkholderia terrae]|jgi:hypothetical protein|uniref:Uncharacterized protein n=1 Tax=Paraburkholderia terrae TaxID=311230 RepID=A0A2I8EJT1_9BURK|nr:hypothetical protein C2L65_05440 [Paraburkholderia terrae]